MEIAKDSGLKYNTIRSILQNFYQNGRVNVKKKMSGYSKGQKQDKADLGGKCSDKLQKTLTS